MMHAAPDEDALLHRLRHAGLVPLMARLDDHAWSILAAMVRELHQRPKYPTGGKR